MAELIPSKNFIPKEYSNNTNAEKYIEIASFPENRYALYCLQQAHAMNMSKICFLYISRHPAGNNNELKGMKEDIWGITDVYLDKSTNKIYVRLNSYTTLSVSANFNELLNWVTVETGNTVSDISRMAAVTDELQ